METGEPDVGMLTQGRKTLAYRSEMRRTDGVGLQTGPLSDVEPIASPE